VAVSIRKVTLWRTQVPHEPGALARLVKGERVGTLVAAKRAVD